MYQQYAYIMYLHQLVKLKVPLIFLDLFYVYHAISFLPVFLDEEVFHDHDQCFSLQIL